ncbi:MAG: ferritin-like domain-containing protein [Actinomycetota bacterium]|nr:ferritin-like domain-containing protein [Actinomycetota bacterium]
MGEDSVQDMLVSYVRDAHAMEKNVLTMLNSLINTTKDEVIVKEMEHHKSETEEHERLLNERLEALGGGTAAIKDVPAMLGALLKGVADVARSDKAGKNARDAYITEAMEIAAYELLERLANRAGDKETAEVARRIKADEYAMREKIEKNWDRFLDLTLEEKVSA